MADSHALHITKDLLHSVNARGKHTVCNYLLSTPGYRYDKRSTTDPLLAHRKKLLVP